MAKSKPPRQPPANDSLGKSSGGAHAASGGVYSTNQRPDGTFRTLLSYTGPSTVDLMALIKGRAGEEADVSVKSDGDGIVTTVDHRGPMPLDFDAPLARPAVEQPGDELVTLDQAASLARISKRTLERMKKGGKLPPPSRKGGGGVASVWLWRELRPAIEQKARRPLPVQFPG